MTKPRSSLTASPRSTDGEFWFDEETANRAAEFFPRFLRHTTGEWAGQPFELAPWQRDDIIRPLFGWKKKDGTRRYRSVYVEIPRKNAKTTLAAGVGCYLLFSDNEPGAQVFSAAADRAQASLVFDPAKDMVQESPELAKRPECYMKSIVVPSTRSFWRVLSADVKTKHGLNPHAILFDELHTQPNRNLWDVLKTARGARRQPVLFAMTTAGYDRNSICWQIHDYALKVQAGIIKDDSFLGVIYAADPDKDDWRDEKVWRRVNPLMSYGSPKIEFLREELQKAVEMPAEENTFKRLYLNIWTEQATRWIPMDQWDKCHGLGIVPDLKKIDALATRAQWLEMLKGRRCFAGLDLASTIDIAALLLLFPPTEDDELWRLLPFFWVPEENMRKRAEKDRVPYDLWADQEFIRATEGNVIDYDAIKQDILQLFTEYDIREIAFDRWNATQLTTQLEGEGLAMVPFGQGFQSMAAPTREATGQISGKQIGHGANPVLRWMASNVAVRQDPAGNMKPDKEKSSERIDGIVAWMMALGRAIVQPEDLNPYSDRGLLTV